MPAPLSLNRLVEELTLIRCSLLLGEHFTLLDPSGLEPTIQSPAVLNDTAEISPETVKESQSAAEKWQRLLTADASLDDSRLDGAGASLQMDDMMKSSPARFRLAVDGARVSFEVDSQRYDGECESINECIGITGDNLSRAMQEHWRERIKDGLKGVKHEAGGGEVEFPLYQLISLRLLPLLHESTQADPDPDPDGAKSQDVESPESAAKDVLHHVLFTSHHLISSTKRRNLQGWSSSLRVAGFAKVGYPGVIYAQGLKHDIEEFIGNVKAMQWLALKVRFVEPLEGTEASIAGEEGELKGWREFEKVREVVEEMRKLGRGKYVVEMGIGAGGRV